MSRHPAAPPQPSYQTHPVQVRLIGEDTAVRSLVAVLQRAVTCGPADYRPARSGGTRAYMTVIVPAAEGDH